MSGDEPYNPLDKFNLAKSIANAALASAVKPLSSFKGLVGAGVYLIYYAGPLNWYSVISEANQGGKFNRPIYIGKAIPKGGRKGGMDLGSLKSRALQDRLGQHFESVDQATNLSAADFYFRSLTVDDIWIPLGENMLIQQFQPAWNRVIDGFGNKDPGKRRATQYRSPWDVIHPGRHFAEKLARHPMPAEELTADLIQFLQTGAVPKRAKQAAVLAEEEETEDKD